MRHYTTYVGMDVHTRSVTCEGICPETAEYFCKTFKNCPKAIEIVSWLKTLPQPIYCAYESGCCGFTLVKELRKCGIDCDLIAISTLKASDKTKKRKSDKVDARNIMHEISHPDTAFSVVYVPTDEQLAAKELSRLRCDAVSQLKKSKQTLVSFLQRYGYVYSEKTKSGNYKKRWTKRYFKWLEEIKFEQDMLKDTFIDYVQTVKSNQLRATEINTKIKEYAKQDNIKPFIDAFRCVKGIDLYSAFLYFAEFSDFSRFRSARKVACFVGMVPKNHSSGQKDIKGHITKAGNKFIRKNSIESLGAISRWGHTNKAIPIDADISSAVSIMAADANTRIKGKHKRMKAKGKNANVAKVACATELIKWVWAIGRQVEYELCAS